MTSSTTFDFKTLVGGLEVTHTVRTVTRDGEPWFVAKDVCAVLGLTNSRWAAAGFSTDERGVNRIDTLGGPQNITVISEAGLYKLVMRSDKPVAKPFQDWVTREVLPSIRKTGSYALQAGETIPLPTSFAEALSAHAKAAMAHALEVAAHAETAIARMEAEATAAARAAEVERLTPSAEIGERAMSVRRTIRSVAEQTCPGVNTMAVKKDLAGLKYLYRTSNHYRVYAQYKDTLFQERVLNDTGHVDIFCLPEGVKLIQKLYRTRRLTMRKGHTVQA